MQENLAFISGVPPLTHPSMLILWTHSLTLTQAKNVLKALSAHKNYKQTDGYLRRARKVVCAGILEKVTMRRALSQMQIWPSTAERENSKEAPIDRVNI